MARSVFPATADEAMERHPAPWALVDEGGGFSSIRDARGGLVTFPLTTGTATAIMEAVNFVAENWRGATEGSAGCSGGAITGSGGGAYTSMIGGGGAQGPSGGSAGGSGAAGFVERDPLVGGLW